MSGPLPKYQPCFTKQEVDQAKKIIRQRNAPHTQVQRAKMVLALSEDASIAHQKLADSAGVSHPTAQKWRKRWFEEGFTLTDHPRSGRPPDFSPSANR